MYFVGPIRHLFDAWIVGDALLRQLWPTFTAQKSKAIMDQVSKPFLFEHYNTTPFYPAISSGTKSVLSRISNQFNAALNNMKTMPKYVILITGLNIVEAGKHGGAGGKQLIENITRLAFLQNQ